ncbi:hypothetical protein M0R45_001919 [Rubus argutus]|uniref:RNA helicase n=1 Tax=Rubus argutus TaxID=59490 RepID=A0AAW1VK65_RUBAR
MGGAAKTLLTLLSPQISSLYHHSVLLERLRLRHLKNAAKPQSQTNTKPIGPGDDGLGKSANKKKREVESFEELGLTEEVMEALREMGIEVPTEIQSIGIPAVLEGKTLVLGSHTGSGKTLAYMLPLAQLLRRDEAQNGIVMNPGAPELLCYAPQESCLSRCFVLPSSSAIMQDSGLLWILQHIEDGNLVYGDIKYVVLDEADTMFDRGFGPDIRKFLAPLKNRASKPDGQGFQTVLVSATMTKAVQTLIDEEFQGILHLRTSTLHKKIASARHDFIKLSGSENKMEALLQVLEPSLAKGNRVMVFCNTLNSSRAVDHFLNENQISTVNYHGEVPAEQRVENLKKFKSV